jgi:hypothetical protein
MKEENSTLAFLPILLADWQENKPANSFPHPPRTGFGVFPPNLLCLVLMSLPRKALSLFFQEITTF